MKAGEVGGKEGNMVTRGKKSVNKEKSDSKNIMQTTKKQALSKPHKPWGSGLSFVPGNGPLLPVPFHRGHQEAKISLCSPPALHESLTLRPSRKLGETRTLSFGNYKVNGPRGPAWRWISLPWQGGGGGRPHSHPSSALQGGCSRGGLFREAACSVHAGTTGAGHPPGPTHPLTKAALFVKGFWGQEAINRVKRPRCRG